MGRLRGVLLWLLLLGIVGGLIWFTARPPAPLPVPSATSFVPATPSRTPPTPTNAVVSWIADGDTLDATFEGRRTRIRLLNIDAPELGHDGAKDQCLAVAARDLLERLLPRGSRVRVIPYGRDRFDRLLAGVYLGADRLVNVEVVRAGLAAPIVVDGNVRLLGVVRQAQQDADEAEVGLHAATGCSIPGRVAAAAEALTALPDRPTADQRPAVRERARTLLKRLRAIEADLTADARNALVQGLLKDRREALLIQTRALIVAAAVRAR